MKSKKSHTNRTAVTINLSNCKYDVVRNTSLGMGMQEVSDDDNWIINWIDTGASYERILEMKSYQRINHFPGMHEICRKDQLARKASRIHSSLRVDFNFLPRSWILPLDYHDFVASYKPKRGHCFISKPEHGCQGKGIFLFKDPKEIQNDKNTPMVVQNYISNPYLIDGYKFDLRIYVLVTSIDPLRIFVYKDGLARFATEKYHVPTSTNRSKSYMHLTNYAINKTSSKFNYSQENGSKRSISSVMEEIDNAGGDSARCWRRIQDVIVKTVILVEPAIKKFMKPWFDNNENINFSHTGSQCFEILGFDILLDSKLKPWLLEVNHSPSFACDTSLDSIIKSGVIGGALKLLSINSNTQKKHVKEQKKLCISRLLKVTKSPTEDSSRSSPTPATTRGNSCETLVEDSYNGAPLSNKDLERQEKAIGEYRKKYNPLLLQKLSAWEDQRIGNYKRIFPPENEHDLGKYLLIAESLQRSNSTKALQKLKQFREAQIEQELCRQRRISAWKEKQKSLPIKSKISILADGAPKMTAGVRNAGKSQLYASRQVYKMAMIMDVPNKVELGGRKSLNAKEKVISRINLSSNLDGLIHGNSLIVQKQSELKSLRTTVFQRLRRN